MLRVLRDPRRVNWLKPSPTPRYLPTLRVQDTGEVGNLIRRRIPLYQLHDIYRLQQTLYVVSKGGDHAFASGSLPAHVLVDVFSALLSILGFLDDFGDCHPVDSVDITGIFYAEVAACRSADGVRLFFVIVGDDDKVVAGSDSGGDEVFLYDSSFLGGGEAEIAGCAFEDSAVSLRIRGLEMVNDLVV